MVRHFKQDVDWLIHKWSNQNNLHINLISDHIEYNYLIEKHGQIKNSISKSFIIMETFQKIDFNSKTQNKKFLSVNFYIKNKKYL